MRQLLSLLLAVCPLCAAAQARLPLNFVRDPGWQPRPSYLANPARHPSVRVRDGAAEMEVDEPGNGMKFELPLSPFSSAGGAYLVVRYRASGLGTGAYALWAFTSDGPGRELLNTRDLRQDGQWHTAALDLVALGEAGAIRALVTDVECAGPPARMAVGLLELSDEAPPGANVFPASRPTRPPFAVRVGGLSPPVVRPTWLASPSPRARASFEGGSLHLRVEGPGLGMKWSTPLIGWPDLSAYRYVTVRYRARGMARPGDYFLWLGSQAGGMPQQTATLAPLADLVDDGEWQTAVYALQAPFTPVEMAFQLQSGGAAADAWIESVRFTAERPLLSVVDLVPIRPGLAGSRLSRGSARLQSLTPDGVPVEQRLKRFGLTGWPSAPTITARGIPFRLHGFLLSPGDIRQDLEVPVRGTAREVYLLMAARLPALDFSGVMGGAPMRRFDNPERFVARIAYSDGVTDEIFPVRVGGGRCEVTSGVDVYCLADLRHKPIRRLSLRNRMDSAAFLVGGVTLNDGKPLTPVPAVAALPPPDPETPRAPGPGWSKPIPGGVRIGNSLISLDIGIGPGVSLRAIGNRCLSGGRMRIKRGPLFALGVGGKRVPSTRVAVWDWQIIGGRGTSSLAIQVDGTTSGVPLKGSLRIWTGHDPDIHMELDLQVTGNKAVTPVVQFPLVSGVTLGSAKDTWYLWCRKGGWVNRVDCSDRRHYGGEYPLQVADLFNPALGGGISLATYDVRDIYKTWGLDKDPGGASWRIEYFPREYRPGETVQIAPTALRAHTGDWRAALAAYRRRAAAWYRPQVPRKLWFQRCFSYRQHYAWTDLRDPRTGKWRMDEVIAADRAFFGCLDYLHIFDFGQSQTYGRVGDYNHYDELGGREAMSAAIASAKRQGVRVGLYIEGYLCDQNSLWGRETPTWGTGSWNSNVLQWGIRQADGKPLLWAPDSTEHMMCPAAGGWRSHLAEVYHRVAGELAPSGMYIDQYGFGDTWKVCWSRDHGHPVPAGPVRGEDGTLQAIRANVPPDIATLTEETPCDVNSQYQDGALGYSVAMSDPEMAPGRVDLFRFQFPSFKVFQLVSYNDFVEGGWHLLKGPFFNGEGTWLANSVPGGFCPDAQSFLRRAFGVLHRYADAFTSSDVEALVPTLRSTLYANRFTGPKQTVWTLYNAEYRTARGEVLRVPARPGARYVDAFTSRPIPVRRQGDWTYLSVALGPRDVGCLVEER